MRFDLSLWNALYERVFLRADLFKKPATLGGG